MDEETVWFEQFGCEEGDIIGLDYGPDTDLTTLNLMSTLQRSLENTTCLPSGIDIGTDFLRCSQIYVIREEFDNEDPLIIGALENTKERFFNSLLHEFGHAHYLLHVANSTELMWGGLLTGSTATITQNAILASRHIQSFSELHECEDGPYDSHECFVPNSVEEVEKNPENSFKIFTDSENILIQKKNVVNVKEIRIFDILGRLHEQHLINHSNETIQIPRVRTSGIYIVTIRDDANILYLSLIHI